MKKFEKTSRSYDIYGKVAKLRLPTVSEANAYKELYEKSEGEAQVNALFDFLAGLGLDKELAMSMEAEHFGELVEDLLGSKKK